MKFCLPSCSSHCFYCLSNIWQGDIPPPSPPIKCWLTVWSESFFFPRYLIDPVWFKQWKRYVGYDDRDSAVIGQVSSFPGPIDNSPLLKGNWGLLKLVAVIFLQFEVEVVWLKCVMEFGSSYVCMFVLYSAFNWPCYIMVLQKKNCKLISIYWLFESYLY